MAKVSVIVLLASMGVFSAFARSSQQEEDPFERAKQLYFIQSDFQGALEAYRLVPVGSPNYATAQRHIGYNIYGREWGRWEEGIPFLEEAFRVAPTDPNVLEDIGRAYIQVGMDRLEQAETDVTRAALRDLNAGVQAWDFVPDYEVIDRRFESEPDAYRVNVRVGVPLNAATAQNLFCRVIAREVDREYDTLVVAAFSLSRFLAVYSRQDFPDDPDYSPYLTLYEEDGGGGRSERTLRVLLDYERDCSRLHDTGLC